MTSTLTSARATLPRRWPAARTFGVLRWSRQTAPRIVQSDVLAFMLPLFAYLATASFLVLQWHLIVRDSWSRVGNALYVIASRDPHLAAIGFVWSPLPSIIEIPLVALRDLWPALVKEGFASNIVSAVCMAAAVRELWLMLGDSRTARPARIGLTVVFAAHPMIVHYGANGASEALFLLLLLVAVRNLARWLRRPEAGPLVTSGIAIGFSYLVRYEAGAIALGAMLMTALVSAARTRGTYRWRFQSGLADAVIFIAPAAFTFTVWTMASWIIVGHPFEQFTSLYGNAAQLRADQYVFLGTGQGTPAAPKYVGQQIAGLAPFVLPLFVLAAAIAWRRRDPSVLACVAIFGSVLAFASLAFLQGATQGWLRFYIVVVPLASLLAGAVLAPETTVPPRVAGSAKATITPLRLAAMTAVIACAAAGLPSGLWTMFDAGLGRGETTSRSYDIGQYLSGEQIAAHLDSLALGDGTVLVDSFMGFPVILHSDRPRQFIITSDRDFPQALADPLSAGVQYILVPPPNGLAQLDSVNRQWPGIFDGGAGIATLQLEFSDPMSAPGEQVFWRLYLVTQSAPR